MRRMNERGMTLTQAELVNVTGLAESTIIRLRSGAKPPLARTVKVVDIAGAMSAPCQHGTNR